MKNSIEKMEMIKLQKVLFLRVKTILLAQT